MADEIETVDAEVVPATAEPRTIEPAKRSLSPVSVQAAVAATGFAAGVVTVAAVQHRRRTRQIARRRPRGMLGKVVASRSFLVDVHLLGD
ncbi:MAG TPA: hypothetical protein VFB41_05920 [Solirubrobacteraceae bacterium]|nr:hypothetical protein [Solirubrobacteraceae bacterium]